MSHFNVPKGYRERERRGRERARRRAGGVSDEIRAIRAAHLRAEAEKAAQADVDAAAVSAATEESPSIETEAVDAAEVVATTDVVEDSNADPIATEKSAGKAKKKA